MQFTTAWSKKVNIPLKWQKNILKKNFFEDFKISAKCWICENDYVGKIAKESDHFYNTGKHIGSAHKGCNINIKLFHKIPVVFNNLKKYDSRIIMQNLDQIQS